MRALRLALLAALAPAWLAAQGILVAPHSIFIDHRTRGGFVELYNPEARPVEVELLTLYGYPVTNALGQLELRVVEAPGKTDPSASGWIQVLPRRVLIPPLTKQTIRLLGRPPAETADGEYWARLEIRAKEGQVAVNGADSTPGIQMRLNLEVRTIIPVYYRKGPVTSGLELSDARATVEPDSIGVRLRLKRSGNAAYIGTVRGSLRDQGNREVQSFSTPIAVYYDIDPRFGLSRAGLAPGRYTLHLEVAPERTDIPPEQLLRSAPVRTSVPIVVP
jgi:P pilus assembly chaperone PapD